ncbi:hypothetical protein CPT_Phriendly_013 [Vibrio phage Phriendly]|nr:hypothetical protein CPT_Phriendly_013 [Vibrio phage Phriendly]
MLSTIHLVILITSNYYLNTTSSGTITRVCREILPIPTAPNFLQLSTLSPFSLMYGQLL